MAEARAANHSPPPVYVVSSPMARVPPLTARPRLYEREPTLAPLTSPQIATSVAEAGSKSTRGLQAINCRFKNMESRAQPKQRGVLLPGNAGLGDPALIVTVVVL